MQNFYVSALYMSYGFMLSQDISPVISVPVMNELEIIVCYQISFCLQHSEIKVGECNAFYGGDSLILV